jgi:hypothetical protein
MRKLTTLTPGRRTQVRWEIMASIGRLPAAAFLLLSLTTACHVGGSQTHAFLNLPETIAVGAQFDAAVVVEKGSTCVNSDCTGGELASGVTIISAAVDDPTVFSVTFAGDKLSIHALAEGATYLRLTATTDEGGEYSTSKFLQSLPPTGIRARFKRDSDHADWGCDYGWKPSAYWLEAGKSYRFEFALMSGPYVVYGIPLPVEATGSGFTVASFTATAGNGVPFFSSAVYATSAPGTLTLVEPDFAVSPSSFGIYDCPTYDGMTLAALATGPYAQTAPFRFELTLGGEWPCMRPSFFCPVTVTVLTPDICDVGSPGVSTLQLHDYSADLLRKQSGTCRISASLDGTSLTSTAEFVFAP